MKQEMKTLKEHHGKVVLHNGTYRYMCTMTLNMYSGGNELVNAHAYKNNDWVLFYTSRSTGLVVVVQPTEFTDVEWLKKEAYVDYRIAIEQLRKNRKKYSKSEYHSHMLKCKDVYLKAISGVLYA